MLKSLKSALEAERIVQKIPKSAQNIIPIDTLYPDGIAMTRTRAGSKYSKVYRLSDINYMTASMEEQKNMFLGYSNMLNGVDAACLTSITIINESMADHIDIEALHLPLKQDELNNFRKEYNAMLENKLETSNKMYQSKFLTLTTVKKNYEEAAAYFDRQAEQINKSLSAVGSSITRITANERMQIYFRWFRKGAFRTFDYDEAQRSQRDFKDYIVPSAFTLKSTYYESDDKFGRTLVYRNFPNFLRDTMIDDLSMVPCQSCITIDLIPVRTDEAQKEGEMRLMAVESKIAKFEDRQKKRMNYLPSLPYPMKRQKDAVEDFLDDLTQRDQRLFYGSVVISLMADTLESLDLHTSTFNSVASEHRCDLSVLYWQQLEGIQTALPFGHRRIDALRTFTTESLAVLIPFRAQDITHPHGVYYGQNSVTGNLVLVDRAALINGNSFILGASGSGKSFAAKREIFNLYLKGDCDIIIIDPEREYGQMVKRLGGSVIDVSATSSTHINALDISRDYGEGTNPLIEKSEYIISLCEQVVGDMLPEERSIIDRCVKLVYRDYIRNGYKGNCPTLVDFASVLSAQTESIAQDLALKLELFTRGSLSIFSYPTNVDVTNRLMCFDIHSLGRQLYTVGISVVLDAVVNRLSRNRQNRRITYIFIDEIYLLFQNPYSELFISNLWRRLRKYWGYATGISQNVSDILQSEIASKMIYNSEFLVLLKQSGEDLRLLSDLFHFSETQLSHITDSEQGSGLAKVGSALIPIRDNFPSNTEMYRLMTTKPSDQI